MSLINKMLKDLEARRKKQPKEQDKQADKNEKNSEQKSEPKHAEQKPKDEKIAKEKPKKSTSTDLPEKDQKPKDEQSSEKSDKDIENKSTTKTKKSKHVEAKEESKKSDKDSEKKSPEKPTFKLDDKPSDTEKKQPTKDNVPSEEKADSKEPPKKNDLKSVLRHDKYKEAEAKDKPDEKKDPKEHETKERPAKETFTLDGDKPTAAKEKKHESPKPTASHKKSANSIIKHKPRHAGPIIFDNQIIPAKKSSWKKYINSIILLAILAIVIVALVFAAIAFHDRWQKKKISAAVPAVKQKSVNKEQQPQGEANNAAVPTSNAPPTKEQELVNQAMREHTNKITASLIGQPADSRNFKPPVGSKQTSISVKKALTPEEWANNNYQQALSQIDAGSTSRAIGQLVGILRKIPDYKPARVALAATLVQQGRDAEAQRVLISGLREDPHYPPYAQLIAHLLVQDQQIPQALDVLKKAQPESISQNPSYFAFMAALYMQQGQYQQSASLYQQLTKINDKEANWWAGLAISLRKLGQLEQANQAAEQAKANPGLSPELAAYLQQ